MQAVLDLRAAHHGQAWSGGLDTAERMQAVLDLRAAHHGQAWSGGLDTAERMQPVGPVAVLAGSGDGQQRGRRIYPRVV